MLIDIAPDEDEIRIPCVAIYIPGMHGRVRIEPLYVLPLFKAVWKGNIADEAGDPLRVIPFPDYVLPDATVRRLPSASAMSIEEARLRTEFGQQARTGIDLFDVVYPGNTFGQAYTNVIKDATYIKGADKVAEIERAERRVRLAKLAALAASEAAINAATDLDTVKNDSE